jgi:hypothetical protein
MAYKEGATRTQCRCSRGVVDVGMKAFYCAEIIVLCVVAGEVNLCDNAINSRRAFSFWKRRKEAGLC